MTIKVITEELVAEISRSYPTLNALNLSSNEICEIQNLSPLGALVALNLSNNSLSELGGIGNKILPNLRQLDVSISKAELHAVLSHHWCPQHGAIPTGEFVTEVLSESPAPAAPSPRVTWRAPRSRGRPGGTPRAPSIHRACGQEVRKEGVKRRCEQRV